MGVICDPGCAQWATAFDDCVCTNKASHVVIEVGDLWRVIVSVVIELFIAGLRVLLSRHLVSDRLRELFSATDRPELCEWQL